MTSTDQNRRGAAYHEAGHACVAWCFGLEVMAIEIEIDGDNAAGKAYISLASHLPIVNRIAICFAGIEAQDIFGCPTHEWAGTLDYAKVIELIEDGRSGEESLDLRNAGHNLARALLLQHQIKVARLAKRLIEAGRIDAHEFIALMRQQ